MGDKSSPCPFEISQQTIDHAIHILAVNARLASSCHQPLAFIILTGYGILGSIATPWLGEALVSNFNMSISVATLVIGQAVLVAGVRDALSFHIKLDKLLERTAPETIGVEHEDAKELEAEREEVEKKNG